MKYHPYPFQMWRVRLGNDVNAMDLSIKVYTRFFDIL